MAIPEEEAAVLCCPSGHELHLTRFPDIRKRLCSQCRECIGRSTPRLSCRWCAYNVCYGCAAQHPCREWKESGKKAVAISRYYDIVAPEDGEMRQHCHSRKGFAISDDCRSPEFSDAGVSLVGPGGSALGSHDYEQSLPPSCELAEEVCRRGMQLLDIVDAEVSNYQDCLDRDWRPELPAMPEDAGSVRAGSILSWLLGGGDEVAKIKELCAAAQEVLRAQPVVQEVPAPAKVFGDIHGQLRDLLLLFHFYGRPGQLSETVTSASAARTPRAGGGPPVRSIRSVFSRSMSIVTPGHRKGAARSMRRRPSWGHALRSMGSLASTQTGQSSFASLMHQARSLSSAGSGLPQPSPVAYVFNGDWVDRGRHQLEVVVLLLAMKVVFPSQVFLNRGNHEDRGQNAKTSLKGSLGFDKACLLHFSGPIAQQVFEAFHETFDWLPLAARIDGRVLVLHGGLGSGDWTLDMMRAVERPLRLSDVSTEVGIMVYNTLWSDPLMPDRKKPVETFGVHASHRSKHSTVMKAFGRDVTESFCKREGIGLVIRSHQFKQWGKGYELMHDGLIMRVFSARNYCGTSFNDGGILLVGRDESDPSRLLVRAQNIERMSPRRQLKGTVNDVPEPYCPHHHLMQFVMPRPPPACLSLGCVFRPEVENVECNVCGAEELEADCYYSCRGCSSYDMCRRCASEYSGKSAPIARKAKDLEASGAEARNEDPDSDSDSSPLSGPTLLTGRAGKAVLKPG